MSDYLSELVERERYIDALQAALDPLQLTDHSGDTLAMPELHFANRLLTARLLTIILDLPSEDDRGLSQRVFDNLTTDYAVHSPLYTRRVLPRYKYATTLALRFTETHDQELLIEAADHISQGWPTF